jgi:uncharacterized protein (TIGR00369 family)
VARLIDRIQAGEVVAPVSELVGFRLISVESGKAVFELEAGPQHRNPMGTLHGGVLCDVADAAMGIASASTLADGESFTTLELKINFLRSFRDGTLTATARMVKTGRTVGLAECDVTDADGRLIARAMSTCMTLRGEEREARRAFGP